MPTTGGSRVQVTPNTAEPFECSFTGPRGDTIVYSGFDGIDFEIYTIPATGGTPTQLTDNFGVNDFSPSFTVIGKRIAFDSMMGAGVDQEIWTIDLTGGTPNQLTFNNLEDRHPDYRPDGARIVYASLEETPTGAQLDYEILTMPATGGTRTQLTFNNTDDSDPSWQPRP
jgi:TolB protein